MAVKFSTLRKRMLSDPEARAEYERLGPEFQMASALIAARRRANLTQEQVARRMATTQTAVARMESGRHVPSMKSILRYAEATGSKVAISLEPE